MPFKTLKKRVSLNSRHITTVSCPICNNESYHFLDAGAGQYPRYKCKKCASTEYDRLLYFYFIEFTHLLNTNSRILHINPSPVFLDFFSKRSTIDYTPCNLGDFPKIQPDHLPYEDGAFDAVIIGQHNMSNATAEISELSRVMRAKGNVFFDSHPTTGNPFADIQTDRFTFSTKKFIKGFSSYDLRTYGLVPDMDIVVLENNSHRLIER